MTDEVAADIFGEIYRSDHWRGGSGQGSTEPATAPYRHILERLLVSGEIRSVVDVGCGDWQLGALIDWHGVEYTGLDVVEEVIATNQARWSGDHVRFEALDVRSQPLPSADLLLAKDVLQHWPCEDVSAFLAKAERDYPFALITNDVSSVHWDREVNCEIQLGEWRTLDVEAPPFDVKARATWDFDVGGEWTKRVVLLASRRAWTLGAVRPRSVRRIAASIQTISP